MSELQKYFTLDEVAEALQLKVETIRRYVRAGKLKVARFGRRYRVRPDELERFVRAMEGGEEGVDVARHPLDDNSEDEPSK